MKQQSFYKWPINFFLKTLLDSNKILSIYVIKLLFAQNVDDVLFINGTSIYIKHEAKIEV